MKKSANYGTLYPRARVGLNDSSGTRLCAAVGTTALTTTLTKYTLSCQTTAAVAMTATDKFYLWAGVNLTTGDNVNSFKAQLSIEGTAGGNYDSLVTIPLPVNAPPTVNLTAPANNATAAAGSNVAIAATAGDTDGTVSKVEFYQGTTKLGEDTAAPYSFAWANVSAGNYQLTVKAIDNFGATTTSSVVNLGVTGNVGLQLSKEYIYADGKLLAIEENGGAAPTPLPTPLPSPTPTPTPLPTPTPTPVPTPTPTPVPTPTPTPEPTPTPTPTPVPTPEPTPIPTPTPTPTPTSTPCPIRPPSPCRNGYIWYTDTCRCERARL